MSSEATQPGDNRPRKCRTVHDVIELYLPQAKRDVAPATFEGKLLYLTRFDEACGQIAVTDLRPFDLQRWLNTQESTRSEWTIRRAISTIKRAFNWALDMELIERNPLGRYRSRGKLTSRRNPMKDEHFQAFMRYSPPAYRRFLIFLKFTGCRPGEACAMRWGDVRFEKRCVILKEHKTAGKTGKPRIIPLVPAVIKMLLWMRQRRQTTVIGLLERLLRNGPVKGIEVARFMSHYGVSDRAVAAARKSLGVIRERVILGVRSGYYTYRLPDDHTFSDTIHPDDDFVFKSCLGRPLNKYSLNCFMIRVRKRAGLPNGVVLYQLRHRFGFIGTKNKVNLKLLSLAMGHASTTMTEHYIDTDGLADEVLQAALEVCYGPGAVAADVKIPERLEIPTISPPPVGEIPVTTEHVPSRYRNGRPRPNVKADLADVPLPIPGASDPGEQSVETMLRLLMSRIPGQKKPKTYKQTSSQESLNPTHEKAYRAVAWAIERNPALATANDNAVYEWLKTRPDCPCKLPPMFSTFARYVSAARLFHDTRKRVLTGRPPRQPAPNHPEGG